MAMVEKRSYKQPTISHHFIRESKHNHNTYEAAAAIWCKRTRDPTWFEPTRPNERHFLSVPARALQKINLFENFQFYYTTARYKRRNRNRTQIFWSMKYERSWKTFDRQGPRLNSLCCKIFSSKKGSSLITLMLIYAVTFGYALRRFVLIVVVVGWCQCCCQCSARKRRRQKKN